MLAQTTMSSRVTPRAAGARPRWLSGPLVDALFAWQREQVRRGVFAGTVPDSAGALFSALRSLWTVRLPGYIRTITERFVGRRSLRSPHGERAPARL